MIAIDVKDNKKGQAYLSKMTFNGTMIANDEKGYFEQGFNDTDGNVAISLIGHKETDNDGTINVHIDRLVIDKALLNTNWTIILLETFSDNILYQTNGKWATVNGDYETDECGFLVPFYKYDSVILKMNEEERNMPMFKNIRNTERISDDLFIYRRTRTRTTK